MPNVSLKNCDCANVMGLHRYDYGQILEIEGLELPEQFEVHFQNGTGTPVTTRGTYSSESGIGNVSIPDECLQQEVNSFDAWLWVENENSGKTLKTITFYLQKREKPEGVPPISSVSEIKGYAEYVKENAEKVAAAEQAAENAENAALTAQNAAADIAERLANGEFNGQDGADGENGMTDWLWVEVYPDGTNPYELTAEAKREALRNEIYVEQYQNLSPDFFFFCAADGVYLGTERKKGDVLKVYIDEGPRFDNVEHFVSLQGEKGEQGEKGDSYILSEQDKQDIAGLINVEPPKWKKVYEVTTAEEVTQIMKSGLNLSQAFVRVQGVATSSNDEITNTSIAFYVVTDEGQSIAGQINSVNSVFNKTTNNINYLKVKAMGGLMQTEASYNESSFSVVKSASNGGNIIKGTVIKSIFFNNFMGAVLGAGTTFEIWGIEA